MKRRVFAGVLLVLLFSCAGFAVPMTKIQYETTEFGTGSAGKLTTGALRTGLELRM